MKAKATYRAAFIIATILISFLAAGRASALESNASISPRAHVTVVTDSDAAEPGKVFHIGLRFRLTKGWHVYWSNPGDAGQQPDLHLQVPEDITASGIEWPTPVRLREGPAMVYAYTGDTTLPLTFIIPASYQAANLPIAVDADWLVCAERCVPEKAHFSLSVPVGTFKASPEKPLIDASLAREPQPPLFRISVSSDPFGLAVQNKLLTSSILQDAWFFPDTWGMVEHAAEQKVVFDGGGFTLTLKPGALYKTGDALSGILVLQDKAGKELYFTVAASPPVVATSNGHWLQLILFALCGGFILNLMPCVFPILAMKALSVLHLSKAERKHIRAQAGFYTLGILVAFAAMAGTLLALRMAGAAAGWGFQFQSPTFVALMVWLLFAIGLNLSGVFIMGMGVVGVGARHAAKQGALGNFFTGLLAVIVATPCVAPFLGAAIAAALAASVPAMFAIFMAMGIGLALPYLLLAFLPALVNVLPRPGAWMETLRQFLAFPMYGASAWLLWVLSRQNDGQGLVFALTGIIAIGLGAWLFGQVRPSRKSMKMVRVAALAVLTLLCVALLSEIMRMPAGAAAATSHTGANEEAFSDARLESLRAAGQPVFVDMTAAWCITCMVNERVAIMPDEVQKVFARDHIAYLKGDWTQQDPAITHFLEQHDSDGVPLYVFYPADQGKPVILPQILTPSMVLGAIDPTQAKGN